MIADLDDLFLIYLLGNEMSPQLCDLIHYVHSYKITLRFSLIKALLEVLLLTYYLWLSLSCHAFIGFS